MVVAVLEADNNKKGDLFGRAMQDLFHALGYEDFKTNVHKAGRELDIKGKHRVENRTLIAECKATKSPTGGSDVNKFAGAVQAEMARNKDREMVAYYASLAGFTAPAQEQEEEAGNRIILLDSTTIVNELVRGRVVVSRELASNVAATCPNIPQRASMGERCALLCHEVGWLWAFFFKVSGRYSYFSLVHADGHGIDDELSTAVIESDAASAKLFTALTYLRPGDVSDTVPKQDEATEAYLSYLERECGGITLEGLPADHEVGAKTIRLESIYVPLHLSPIPRSDKPESEEGTGKIAPSQSSTPRVAVSEVIEAHRHVAILAAPGAGKTTLLKRLAVAYAASERREEVADELPPADWFPLFIRCRQLGRGIRNPILETIQNLLSHAEMSEYRDAFSRRVGDALKAGNVLLLVDGLDEINNPGDRAAFAAQLRTFIGTYPSVRVIVTSREAGFRAVSGAMASVCALYRISDFSIQDIYTLCRAWQHEVVGGTTESANKLARSIISQPRVRALAINPLLLTTLLLVQRWLGEMPSKRSILYDKAIEVLLMTWNTEGHTPIDQEEAVPQLAYAAFSMMTDKRQAISAKGLKDLFEEARSVMPEVLGYARMSASELIDKVEDRSSLLVRSGHVVEDGQLRPLYEFKHLTFQEYLAALAAVESWHPGRNENDDYVEVLAPFLSDESWSEVIPLATVLSGARGAKRMIERLINLLELHKSIPESSTTKRKGRGERRRRESGPYLQNLTQCLADEVQISPSQVRAALDCIIRNSGHDSEPLNESLGSSRFKSEIMNVAWDGYEKQNEEILQYAGALSSHALVELFSMQNPSEEIRRLFDSESERDFIYAAVSVMIACFSNYRYSDKPDRERKASAEMVAPEKVPSAEEMALFRGKIIAGLEAPWTTENSLLAAQWAFSWMGDSVAWPDEHIEMMLNRSLKVWLDSPILELKRIAVWCIWRLPLASGPIRITYSAENQSLQSALESHLATRHANRALQVVAYYAGLSFEYNQEEEDSSQSLQYEDWMSTLTKIRERVQAPGQ
ncbi:NACHT domain-containing protein [Streptomyces sp. NPDC051639]|uniref:NACHT domain-containing protein n=1 Tax=Streptomyces sp. NPDC051639 TaxID=3155671 RepID=UPI003439B7DB